MFKNKKSELMDLHNHTTLSDGIHTPEDIIKNAIKNKLGTVGITDHFGTSKCNSVQEKDIEKYIEEINILKGKYKRKIDVKIGLELCLNSHWSDIKSFPYERLNKLDYVLLEYVDHIPDYKDHPISLKCLKFEDLGKVTDNLNCKIGLAHTDLLTAADFTSLNYEDNLNKIMEVIKKYNIFYELNVNEGYSYFNNIYSGLNNKKVQYLVKCLYNENIELTVGSDTHSLSYYDIENIKSGAAIIELIKTGCFR